MHENKILVVLVTHQLQYLKEADNILILKNGAIQHQVMKQMSYGTIFNFKTSINKIQGTYDVLMKSGEDYLCFLEAEKLREDEGNEKLMFDENEALNK